ncbi:SDR family oxidoreductase [Pleionea sediminis]|uniref:SDR family oxidoreductase n=1 Tax=Pleionea sediminis TaxID=2569479 RepID=UPI002482D01A|nr:SDR family oxidoreductase [Pleionea sediminis]
MQAKLVFLRYLPISKGGVIQLTRTAALEYATRGVRINAVCPAVIHTEMAERITQHEEQTLK